MKRIILALGLFFSLASYIHADTVDEKWQGYIRPGFVTREGSTVGYLDYFLPVWQDKRNLCFVNPKVSLSDDDANEQNMGLGWRHLAGDDNVILGANLFYDQRTSTLSNRFHQVGAGAEFLTKWLDFRINETHSWIGCRHIWANRFVSIFRL